MAADTFEKARSGGVGYDRLYVEVARKLFERGIMLLVGALLSLSAAVEIVFAQPVPPPAVLAPESERRRVDRAVIAGDEVARRYAYRLRDMNRARKERIDKPLRRDPFAQHEAVIERAAVKALVSALYRGRERRIVIHGEVKIQTVFLSALFYPLLVEPVQRRVGIAVEPQFRPVERAPRESLLNKRPRHQCDLVEQNAAECHALNERRRALVLAPEEIKSVAPAGVFYLHQMLRQLLAAVEAESAQDGQNRRDYVSSKRSHRLAAQREGRVVERQKCPRNK